MRARLVRLFNRESVVDLCNAASDVAAWTVAAGRAHSRKAAPAAGGRRRRMTWARRPIVTRMPWRQTSNSTTVVQG